MSIWEKIKSILKRDEVKQIEAPKEMDRTEEFRTFTRADGTEIEIKPELDQTGNQTYEQVFNTCTGQMQSIPKYTIYADELKQLIHPQILNTTIFMDVDSKLLDDPNYSNYIVNALLSRERMSKVIRDYNGYVGGVYINKEGKLDKFIDNGVINTLKLNKEEQRRNYQAEQERRDKEERERIRQEAEKIKFYDDPSSYVTVLRDDDDPYTRN